MECDFFVWIAGTLATAEVIMTVSCNRDKVVIKNKPGTSGSSWPTYHVWCVSIVICPCVVSLTLTSCCILKSLPVVLMVALHFLAPWFFYDYLFCSSVVHLCLVTFSNACCCLILCHLVWCYLLHLPMFAAVFPRDFLVWNPVYICPICQQCFLFC